MLASVDVKSKINILENHYEDFLFNYNKNLTYKKKDELKAIMNKLITSLKTGEPAKYRDLWR